MIILDCRITLIAEIPIAECPIAKIPIAECPIAEIPIAKCPIAECPIAQLQSTQHRGYRFYWSRRREKKEETLEAVVTRQKKDNIGS